MDSVDQLDIFIKGVPGKLFPQVDAYHPGMPVVAVDNIRLEIQMGQRRQHRPAEKGKTLRVVAVAVQLVALKIKFVIHKIGGQLADGQFKDTAVLLPPRQFQHPRPLGLHLVLEPGLDGAVFGDDHPGVNAFSQQRPGQSPRHIRQTARLNERRRFRSHK